MPLLLLSGSGSSSSSYNVVHVQSWASDKSVAGNTEMIEVFVGEQLASNREYDTQVGFDAAFTAYKNTPIVG